MRIFYTICSIAFCLHIAFAENAVVAIGQCVIVFLYFIADGINDLNNKK